MLSESPLVGVVFEYRFKLAGCPNDYHFLAASSKSTGGWAIIIFLKHWWVDDLVLRSGNILNMLDDYHSLKALVGG